MVPLPIPEFEIPIVPVTVRNSVQIFMKREDLIHPSISGNKFWKLFYNFNTAENYQTVITFGGAFSNHIAAMATIGKCTDIKTVGIIRGEEWKDKTEQSATLKQAQQYGMHLKFVSREEYRNKENIAQQLTREFPDAHIIPEGGTNAQAVQGIKMMLSEHTKDFNYLCAAVGTGGTVAGLSAHCEKEQKVIGFTVVKDDSLQNTIAALSGKNNFDLVDASFGGYGKISDDNIRFINAFKKRYEIPLEPIYTGKMMQKLFALADENFFPKGSKVLCFHTGGLQGIEGANRFLAQKNRDLLV